MLPARLETLLSKTKPVRGIWMASRCGGHAWNLEMPIGDWLPTCLYHWFILQVESMLKEMHLEMLKVGIDHAPRVLSLCR